MTNLNELNHYFDQESIARIEDYISQYKVDDKLSYQQIAQVNNKIKFEIGFIINSDILVDITFQENIIEKHVANLKNIVSIEIIETIDNFSINIFVSDEKIIYYSTSSKNKIHKLKQFALEVENSFTRSICQ